MKSCSDKEIVIWLRDLCRVSIVGSALKNEEERWVKMMLEMEKSGQLKTEKVGEYCQSAKKVCLSSDADRRLNYFRHKNFEEHAADRAGQFLVSSIASVSPEAPSESVTKKKTSEHCPSWRLSIKPLDLPSPPSIPQCDSIFHTDTMRRQPCTQSYPKI